MQKKNYAQSWFISSFRHFPAVSFYKAGVMTVFDGDVLDTEAVVEFLTNEARISYCKMGLFTFF